MNRVWKEYKDIPKLNNPLPESLQRAWDADTPAKLGNWLELAGIDPTQVFSAKSIKDHPWIGLEVKFPIFGDAVGVGKVIRCLIHPYGSLLFDVKFDKPTPDFLHVGGSWKLRFDDYMGQVERFRYKELREIAEVVE